MLFFYYKGEKSMRKWWYRRILVMMLVLTSVLSTGFGVSKMQAKADEMQVDSRSANKTTVIPGGMVIGIYMETDGVLVLSTEEILDKNGNLCEPAKNLVKSGDYIVKLNGEETDTKKELLNQVEKIDSEDVVLTVRRDDELIDVKLHCVEVSKDCYKLGIWIKDSMQGLGTVTYITNDNQFGALGHGIHDADTNDLLEISSGATYHTKLIGITPSVKGEPGGLEGIIVYQKQNRTGVISKNTDNGIYGTLNDTKALVQNIEPMEIGKKKDIKLGDATIRCTIENEVKEYDIKIKNVDYYTAKVNKGIVIEVTDEELLEKTGGIVQGMSGSPIIQNGKIIGAVTHVLVNNPAKGYGIFIEDMLEM